MGILDQVLGGAMGGGGFGGMGGFGGLGGAAPRRHGMGSTIAAGVLLALLVKAARQHMGPGAAEGRSFDPHAQQPAPQGGGLGGMLGGLGGMLGGGGLGGLLGGLGGAGALGSVVSQMQQRGYGHQVNSWVGSGQNEPIAPDQLEEALGHDTIEDLQQQTGMPREALLSELATVLPEAVHEATPAGRLPADDELEQIASGPAR